MEQNNGHFIISLDFEIMWGVRDVVTIESYGENLRGERQVIPGLLKMFKKYHIRATFATVGFLFFKNKNELLNNLPLKKPSYSRTQLSPYGDYLKIEVGENFDTDPYHYAWPLIEQIKSYPEQEIGTHTFSHYYCLEEGQDSTQFKADLQAAIDIANKRGIEITSIVFPRNQANAEYLEICRQAGIIVYRDNENSWLYKARSSINETSVRRALRLADAYINISGHHDFKAICENKSLPVNLPSSRFLRPYGKSFSWLEPLRLRRIKRSMTHAAKNNLTYHLWWHPHNFGINQAENFLFLENVLKHYQLLNKKYNFKSATMTELAIEILK